MKKIIDQNGRLFGRISVIDVVVILAVAGLCFAVYMKQNVLPATATTSALNTSFTAVIKGELIADYVVDQIRVGDTIYDKDHATGGAIGVVTEIEITDGTKTQAIYDGTYAQITAELEKNIRITIVGNGNYENGRFVFNRVYELGANAARNFETKYARFVGVVESVSITPEQ